MGACKSGRVAVFANVPQCTVSPDAFNAIEIVQGLLQLHGRLFAFFRRSAFPDGSFKAVAEFCDVSAVVRAVSSFNNFVTSEASRSCDRTAV